MKAFKIVKINQIKKNIPMSIGLLWLISALLFIVTVVLLLLKKDWWWIIAIPAILLSQILIIVSWKDTKFGTVINLTMLLGIFIGYGVWSFNKMVREEVKLLVGSTTSEKKIVSKEMISTLPPVVQRWLKKSNVIGKENIYSVYLKQSGEIRTSPDGKWMPVEAGQWFTTKEPAFIWIADVRYAPGIYLSGRDIYKDGKGHTLIKLLSLIPIADVKGKEVDQAAMLRYLVEIIWFPSAALNDYIQWEQIDSTTAKATMTYGKINASGLFNIDVNGNVTNFEAKRYYQNKNGATLEDWSIQIDPNSYKDFKDIKIPTKASVSWKLKEGDFTWYILEIKGIQYNKVSD